MILKKSKILFFFFELIFWTRFCIKCMLFTCHCFKLVCGENIPIHKFIETDWGLKHFLHLKIYETLIKTTAMFLGLTILL